MALSVRAKKTAYLFGVLGAVQALIYFLLSLLCVIYYYEDLTLNLSDISFFKAVYLRFLDDRLNLGFVEPLEFIIYNIMYCVFDFFWFILSINLYYHFAKETRHMYKSIQVLISVLVVIMSLDLIVIIRLSMDFGYSCPNPASETDAKLCENAVLPVLVIACRGFVLEMLNVVLEFMLVEVAKELKPGSNCESLLGPLNIILSIIKQIR